MSQTLSKHVPDTSQTLPKHVPDTSQTCPTHVPNMFSHPKSKCLLCVYYVSTMCLTKSSELSTSGCQPVNVHQVSTKCPPSVHQVSTKCSPSVHQWMSTSVHSNVQSVQLNVQVHTQVKDSMIQANPGQTAPTWNVMNEIGMIQGRLAWPLHKDVKPTFICKVHANASQHV